MPKELTPNLKNQSSLKASLESHLEKHFESLIQQNSDLDNARKKLLNYLLDQE